MNKRLNIKDSLKPYDSLVIYSGDDQDFRGVPQNTIIDEIVARIKMENRLGHYIQRLNPNVDFTLDIEGNEIGTYLVLNPSTSIANGLIKLPNTYNVADGQELLVSSSNQITNLSIDPSNSVLFGAPNTLAASGFFKLKYDKPSNTWYRVG